MGECGKEMVPGVISESESHKLGASGVQEGLHVLFPHLRGGGEVRTFLNAIRGRTGTIHEDVEYL